MSDKSNTAAELVPWDPAFRRAFAELNYQWIEQYFEVEEEDRKALENPEGYALDPGGEIFFVVERSGNQTQAVGTVAMVPHGQTPEGPVFELAKMAVHPNCQGRGYSRLLMEACVAFARSRNAAEIMLVTNDVLAPALGLYRSAGFQLVEMADQRYERGNTQMRLPLR